MSIRERTIPWSFAIASWGHRKDADAGSPSGQRAAANGLARSVLGAGPLATRRPFVGTAHAASCDGEGALPDHVRAFMEPRFGADLAKTRVHTGPRAAGLCRALGARAFTYGADIYFGDGFAPGNDALTAHELAHVLQQHGRPPVVAPQVQLWPWEGPDLTPSRSNAFGRQNEFVARLNLVTQNTLNFRWDTNGLGGNRAQLRCAPITPTTRFQKFLRDFIERTDQVIPLRFVDSKDPDPKNNNQPRWACQDNFFTAAVDLDDLLNNDNWGFQAVVVHILAERYAVPKYVEDILTNPPTPSPSPDPDSVYRDAHFAARDKEGELYKYLFRDPSIVAPHTFCPKDGSPYVIAFNSNDCGYKVIEKIDSLAPGPGPNIGQKNPITECPSKPSLGTVNGCCAGQSLMGEGPIVRFDAPVLIAAGVARRLSPAERSRDRRPPRSRMRSPTPAARPASRHRGPPRPTSRNPMGVSVTGMKQRLPKPTP